VYRAVLAERGARTPVRRQVALRRVAGLVPVRAGE
jgi:hypothetical protein